MRSLKRKTFMASITVLVMIYLFLFHFLHILTSADHCRESLCDKEIATPSSFIETLQGTTITIQLEGVHISVKSTVKYYQSRLQLLVLTWFQTVPSHNLYIVTDETNDWIDSIATTYGFHVQSSSCLPKHISSALSCKCGVEFEVYYDAVASGKRYNWYCHFDDDMYVNTKQLYLLLKEFDPNNIYYFGRWSVNRQDRIPVRQHAKSHFQSLKRDSYYFATGAAYCISKELMREIEPYVRGDKLVEIAQALGTPDDMAVGFVIESILGYNLTLVPSMYSHLNLLSRISQEDLPKQITISYGERVQVRESQKVTVKNIIKLPDGIFSETEDPTRFLSYHCLLHPTISWCETRSLPTI